MQKLTVESLPLRSLSKSRKLLLKKSRNVSAWKYRPAVRCCLGGEVLFKSNCLLSTLLLLLSQPDEDSTSSSSSSSLLLFVRTLRTIGSSGFCFLFFDNIGSSLGFEQLRPVGRLCTNKPTIACLRLKPTQYL